MTNRMKQRTQTRFKRISTHINESKELKCWYKPTVEYSINKNYNFQGKPNKSISLIRLVYAKK